MKMYTIDFLLILNLRDFSIIYMQMKHLFFKNFLFYFIVIGKLNLLFIYEK
jgi:hypothetical protein